MPFAIVDVVKSLTQYMGKPDQIKALVGEFADKNTTEEPQGNVSYGDGFLAGFKVKIKNVKVQTHDFTLRFDRFYISTKKIVTTQTLISVKSVETHEHTCRI